MKAAKCSECEYRDLDEKEYPCKGCTYNMPSKFVLDMTNQECRNCAYYYRTERDEPCNSCTKNGLDRFTLKDDTPKYKEFPIFFNDLNFEAQERLLELVNAIEPSEMNWDLNIIPLTIYVAEV